MSRTQHARPVLRLAGTAPLAPSGGWKRALVVLLALSGLLVGCRGRAEFVRGHDLYNRGLYRDAYRQYWEAYRLSPSDEYFEACRQAATQVAIEERFKGRRLELRGDPAGALEAYSLALEYDDRLPSLRSDYSRVWKSLARVEVLEDELQGADARSVSTWRQLSAVRALASLPSRSTEWRPRLPAAVRSVAEAAIQPLWRSTWAAPLPDSESGLETLIDSWLRFREECQLEAWEEENAAFFGGWREAATSRWVEVGEVLRPFLHQAETAVRRLEAARRALRLVDQGKRFEEAGELVKAFGLYRRARFEDPDCEVAASAEYRVSHRFSSLSRHLAAEAMDEERWETAVGLLEQLLQVGTEDAEARRWLVFSRSRLAQEYVARAHRHADAGRPATALLFAVRAEELGTASGTALARDLRAVLKERSRPRLRIQFRPLSAEDWRLRRDLWAVDEYAMRRLEDEILEAAGAANDTLWAGSEGSQGELEGTPRAFAEGPEGPPDGSFATPSVLSIEDLDFCFSQGVELAGTERFRFVERFGLRENRDRRLATSGLASAQCQLAALEERRREAGVPGRALSEELAEMRRWRVRQLEVQVRSLPREVTAIDWNELVHETAHVRREARLSGFVRSGDRARWLTVELEFLDRVVRGRPAISLAADPREAPSREEVLLRLARKWGRALALQAEEWRHAGLQQLLISGRQDLAAGNRVAATERFALAYFRAAEAYPEIRREAAGELAPLMGWEP